LWKQRGLQWDFTFPQRLTTHITIQDRRQCSVKHTLKHGDLHDICLLGACIQYKIKILLTDSKGQKGVRWGTNTTSTFNLGKSALGCVHFVSKILLPITFYCPTERMQRSGHCSAARRLNLMCTYMNILHYYKMLSPNHTNSVSSKCSG